VSAACSRTALRSLCASCLAHTLPAAAAPCCAPHHCITINQEEFNFEEALKKFNKGALEREAEEEHVSTVGL
jgi:hypothetical protein